MNAKRAKALRRRARQATQHLPEAYYCGKQTKRLGECRRGAYQALKTGRVAVKEANHAD